jgi:hypothetical protein
MITSSIYDLLNQIEGIEFDANMSVFSGFASFVSALDDDPLVKQLQIRIQTSVEDQHTVQERIRTLLDADIEPDYAHPHDIALATYLYTLYQTDPALVRAFLESMASSRPLSWSRWLAEHILSLQAH